MGVPFLFRYLSTKYPTIMSTVKTDILCLDFNAIVHNANRNSDENEIFENSMIYIDSILKKVAKINYDYSERTAIKGIDVDAHLEPYYPKVLFISVDGVASRAKLNQQRARRFCSAIDAMVEGKKKFAVNKGKKGVQEALIAVEKEVKIINHVKKDTNKEKSDIITNKNNLKNKNSKYDHSREDNVKQNPNNITAECDNGPLKFHNDSIESKNKDNVLLVNQSKIDNKSKSTTTQENVNKIKQIKKTSRVDSGKKQTLNKLKEILEKKSINNDSFSSDKTYTDPKQEQSQITTEIITSQQEGNFNNQICAVEGSDSYDNANKSTCKGKGNISNTLSIHTKDIERGEAEFQNSINHKSTTDSVQDTKIPIDHISLTAETPMDINLLNIDEDSNCESIETEEILELIDDSNEGESIWDSNAITPGTIFMDKLDSELNEYIYKRLNSDNKWKNMTVIFSSSRVPGEGEQKIMSYLREKIDEMKQAKEGKNQFNQGDHSKGPDSRNRGFNRGDYREGNNRDQYAHNRGNVRNQYSNEYKNSKYSNNNFRNQYSNEYNNSNYQNSNNNRAQYNNTYNNSKYQSNNHRELAYGKKNDTAVHPYSINRSENKNRAEVYNNKNDTGVQYCSVDKDEKLSCTIYSPDADMIMLALDLDANIQIIREDQSKKKCTLCDKTGHQTAHCKNIEMTEYCTIDITLLKGLILLDIKTKVQFNIDEERVVDDIILLSFFCGNDFLPAIPCLDVRFDGLFILIDNLIMFYNRYSTYLAKDGSINFTSLMNYIRHLSNKENYYYRKKSNMLSIMRARFNSTGFETINLHEDEGLLSYYKTKLFKHSKFHVNSEVDENKQSTNNSKGLSTKDTCKVIDNLKDQKQTNKKASAISQLNSKQHKTNSASINTTHSENNGPINKGDSKIQEASLELFDVNIDTVLKTPAEELKSLEFERWRAGYEYLKGLVWTYHLYTSKTISWSWFYPYHFSPIFKDILKVSEKDFNEILKELHEESSPLTLLEQALVVLPSMSKDLLPKKLHFIYQTRKDLYPVSLEIDMFDKLLPWQGIALLPFVEVEEIREVFKERRDQLDLEDFYRNTEGFNILYSRIQIKDLNHWCYAKPIQDDNKIYAYSYFDKSDQNCS